MQEAFLISRPIVHDLEKFKAYGQKAVPLMANYGGRMLFATNEVEALDGAYDGNRLVMFHFQDIEQLRAFWSSEEYQELRALRLEASDGDVWMVPGAQS